MTHTDDTATVCGRKTCDRPTDGFFICHACAEDLSHTMESVAWMLNELDQVISLQTRYTTGEQIGSGESAPIDFVAADTRRRLTVALGTAAAEICKANGWGIAVNWHDPKSAQQAASWIHWRISAVRLFPEAGRIADEILTAYAAAVYVIDRPVSRQYLGDCETLLPKPKNPCPGRVYGREWRTWAQCEICGLKWESALLREYLISSLRDRLCTAAEIADLGAYLNLSLTRDQTRKRLNQWHKRGTLPNSGQRDGHPVFRFGVAHLLLARYALD